MSRRHRYSDELRDTEKLEHSSRTEMQNNSNCNTTHARTKEQTLTKEDKTNVNIIKNIMSEKKNRTFVSLYYQD